MDYQFQNHHQNQQWRPRPPIHGPTATAAGANLCPTCSFPHSPFCPPNPNSFSQFQFPHHRQPPPPPPPPYGHFPDRSLKRPRVDGENERRLKLVRDHGALPGPNSDPNWRFANGFDPNNHHNHHRVYSHNNHGTYLPMLGQNSGNNHLQGSSSYYGGHHPPSPSLPPQLPPSLFPVGPASAMPPRGPPIPEAASVSAASAQSPAQPYFNSKSFMHSSSGFANQDLQGVRGMLPKQYFAEDQSFRLKHSSSEKPPTVVDASLLFKKPHRSTRPDHFVIILRGLPGSGKSYLAKMLRDIEVENGAPAPRIHSMDDYFMMEVEKVEEDDISKSSVSVRGKKPVVKKVMEYCYEPEMEEAYRSSMLKSFKKTLDEGAFTFIIVDDRNLRKADFAQFWAIAKSSGYEVYILEASYKDPAGCAARNVHGFTLDDIQKMAEQWEEAPSFQLRLDAKSLFSGDDLKTNGIQEVDMDLEDEDGEESPTESHRQNTNNVASRAEDDSPADSSKNGNIWNGEEASTTEVKELGRSKWSNDLDEDDEEQTEPIQRKINALSGLTHTYSKEAKSVRWGDKGGIDGFSISAAKKANTPSLVIGPGEGYNLKSNPLTEENGYISRNRSVESKKPKSVFQEQLRAEHESFKAAFSKRQVRVGLDVDDE